jgi:hypothetical protein
MTFEPIVRWYVAAGAASFAAVAAAFGVWRIRRQAGGRRATAFLLLRLGAIFALLLFVLVPTWRSVSVRSAGPPVAILVDSSASMDLGADGGTRLGAALAAAEEVARAVERSGGEYTAYDFAAGRRPWGENIPKEGSLRRGAREQTDAAAALRELAALYGEGGLAAAVVLSDGVWDTTPAAEGLPRCFTMPPAAEPPKESLVVTGVRAPAAALPGTSLDAVVGYYSTLDGTAEVTVSVAEAGGASADYNFKPKSGSGELTVGARLERPGDHFFRVRPSPGWGEEWFHVRALERPLSVWYWEMAGDADFAFIRRALEEHAGFELSYRFDVGGRVLGSAPRPPERADVIILGNPRAAEITPGDAELLERHVARGGGLLIIVSARPADAGALSAGPLARLSPARVASNVAELSGGQLSTVAYPGEPTIAAAPPAVTHVWRLGPLKEGATPVWQTADGTPALATMPYGSGRVALLSAGGLYRWQLAAGGDGLSRLAAGLTLALYDERARGLTVSRHVARPGDVVEVACRASAEPAVVCADAEGAVKPVALAPAGGDLWAGELEIEGEGRYELTSRVRTAEGIELGKAAILARATPSEYRAFRPRGDNLKALSAGTGGRYFEAGDADGLSRAVAARVKAAPRVSVTKTRNLWPPWLAFPAALSFLVADWIWRRRTGLP